MTTRLMTLITGFLITFSGVELFAQTHVHESSLGSRSEQAPSHVHYAASSEARKPGPDGRLAPRLQRLGSHTFPVTTRSTEAQLFINQGLNLSYGFNHAEAFRAFEEAARLDPDAAMAYWGQALVLGPNINAPMDPADEPRAKELIDRASALKSGVSQREADYIDALVFRYSGNPEDRPARDAAYASAMRELMHRYPDDLDAATLFAESLMDLRPWDYWTPDGLPNKGTAETESTLASVMERHPAHPGANHLWIHLIEPTATPQRAEKAADVLGPLMPAAGHMVHMPSHIYVRVGRYADAAASNRLAIEADEDYITQCRAQGIYPLAYYPHNIHFLWFASTMMGRSTDAIEAGRKTAASVPEQALEELPLLQAFLAVSIYPLIRFGRWQEILELEGPPADTGFLRGLMHYARGFALSRLGRTEEAEGELRQLRAVVVDPSLNDTPATFSSNSPFGVLRIAPEVLAGEIAAARGSFEEALSHLERGVRFEDALVYTEPPDWPMPVRHSLGAVLLAAGRPDEAEVVFWEDLRRNPKNGWALFGLMQSLEAQGKDTEAIAERFREAWTDADVKLTGSTF